ncbi:MAG: hypothetical protein K2H61_09470 [Muribaculaceae bacterium]|nr:hypothetical protein [Muribaculaceae bacterium]
MVYQVRELVREIKIAIDENKESDQLILDEDIETLSMDELAETKIEEAARRVLTAAPLHQLDGGEWIEEAVYWRDKGAGWLKLPDDFMRLLIFKMSDWERPVYEPITAADPQYQLQSSRYRGLRGSPQKPVVAIVSRAAGLVLELYSCKDDTAEVEQALYLPLPKIDRHGGINIPERCQRAVVYEAASLVLATIGQLELSALLSTKSKELLV